MSCCPSSGINYQPCSQSHKMSIGVVVESVAKFRCGSMKEADISIKRAEEEASDGEYLMIKHNIQRGVNASSKNDVQEGSVRATAGLLAANLLMKDSNHIENQASMSAVGILHEKQPTHTMQSFANEALLEPVVGNKTAPARASGKESKRVITDETFENFSGAPKQQVCLPVKELQLEKLNGMENRSKEVLRMKLREVLGTVPSNNILLGDSRTCEVNANEMKKVQTLNGDAHVKPLQNSDTIETDSENVDMRIKRPVTCSLARKRVPARMRPRNFKLKSKSNDKEEHQGCDIFSFAEKAAPSQPCAITQEFSIVEKNNRTKRSCGIKPGDLLSPVTDLGDVQLEKSGCGKKPPVEKLPFGGGVTFPKHGYFDENLEPERGLHNINFNNSSVAREKSQQPDAESPAPQEELRFFKPFGDQSPKPHVDGLSCRWNKMTNTVLSSSMGTYPLSYDKKQNVPGSAQPEAEILLEARGLFKSSTASEKKDDVAELEDANSSTPESSTEEMDAGNGLFSPVRGELDSTEEVSSAKKVYPEVDDVYTSPENGSRLVQKSMLFQSKRHCSHVVDFSDISPSLHSPKASGKPGDLFMECLYESPEEGLARVVSLLGLALEKVKTKMKSVTNKKCSEILVCAAEEIYAQLQDVESQIQTDIEKLTSLKTSKRKHIETRLQEQQEHLKFMHEKFKAEICQYLQDCQATMEGLETQHTELRGAIERQKALHRKLLLQTEATVETHLIDAQRQMMSVRNLGKQKMQQLKFTIAGCL